MLDAASAKLSHRHSHYSGNLPLTLTAGSPPALAVLDFGRALSWFELTWLLVLLGIGPADPRVDDARPQVV